MESSNIIENRNRGVQLENEIGKIFEELGWNVNNHYVLQKNQGLLGNWYPDIALLDGEKLIGIIEIKAYSNNNRNYLTKMLHHVRFEALGVLAAYEATFFMLFINKNAYLFTSNGFYQIDNLPTPNNYMDLTVGEPLNIISIVDTKPHVKKPVESKEQSQLDQVIELIAKLSEGQKEIISNQVAMKEKLDKISEQIETLSGQISTYQSLVSRQLGNADSEEEREKIISSFTDELIEQIRNSFQDGYDLREYRAEENMLIDLFDSAWDKMENDTQKFLISAKIMYKKQVTLGDLIDYSGVCVLVTKALEKELDKRFFTQFMNYMKEHYPGRSNHSQFPTSLLNQYGHPKRQRDYTLGSVPFTLCYKTNDNISLDQQENDKAKLLEFCHAELFTGKSDEEIMDLLLDYGEEIENIKNDYRNPSAHTNQLQRVNAKECIDLVIDVQKLLKRMLDSFDQ